MLWLCHWRSLERSRGPIFPRPANDNRRLLEFPDRLGLRADRQADPDGFIAYVEGKMRDDLALIAEDS